MNAAEYENLRQVEQEHWYYAGKRHLVSWWLHRAGPVEKGRRLLDCGAGTGLFARDLSSELRVTVLDDHAESLAMLRDLFPADQVIAGSCAAIPLASESQDFVTALDVLEHVADDRGAVAEFRRVLRIGGIVAVTVPASTALWSEWDVSLHHHRRYDRQSLRALFPPDDWEIVHVNYTNVIAYPVVWMLRKCAPRRMQGRRPEDRLVPRPINALLRTLFVGMGRWRFPLPFGVSLLLVARRRC